MHPNEYVLLVNDIIIIFLLSKGYPKYHWMLLYKIIFCQVFLFFFIILKTKVIVFKIGLSKMESVCRFFMIDDDLFLLLNKKIIVP